MHAFVLFFIFDDMHLFFTCPFVKIHVDSGEIRLGLLAAVEIADPFVLWLICIMLPDRPSAVHAIQIHHWINH